MTIAIDRLPSQVRTFIALETPPAVREQIARIQREMARIGGARVAWARAEGIHLTLKFLGDVQRERLPEVIEAVRQAAEPIPPLELRTAVTGGFPRLTRPRVLWLGIEAGSELATLHERIEETLFDLGFPLEENAFHPHLTVGRVKDIERGCELPQRFERVTITPISWTAADTRLMSSLLKPTGAEYGVIEALPFSGSVGKSPQRH